MKAEIVLIEKFWNEIAYKMQNRLVIITDEPVVCTIGKCDISIK